MNTFLPPALPLKEPIKVFKNLRFNKIPFKTLAYKILTMTRLSVS